jgi:hypothetical protein
MIMMMGRWRSAPVCLSYQHPSSASYDCMLQLLLAPGFFTEQEIRLGLCLPPRMDAPSNTHPGAAAPAVPTPAEDSHTGAANPFRRLTSQPKGTQHVRTTAHRTPRGNNQPALRRGLSLGSQRPAHTLPQPTGHTLVGAVASVALPLQPFR